MAVIGRDNRRSNRGTGPATITSEEFDPAADTVELPLNLPLLPNYFVGVQQFDGSGDLLDAASAGTYGVEVKAIPTNVWEAPTNTSIDATAPSTLPIQGPLTAVQVTPSGVTGVTTARVVVVAMSN